MRNLIRIKTAAKYLRPFVFFGLATLLAAGCSAGTDSSETSTAAASPPRAIFQPVSGQGSREVILDLEVARTQKERSQGLMGRTSLAPDQGMLFVWATPTHSSFWMKDTYIPLSIAFVSEAGVIIDIQDMETRSLQPHKPAAAYSYAIEANRGFFDAAGIHAGDQVRFTGI
ncbi:MAG: DUF192 domain-containing protein [Thermoleophilia bacterium]